MLGAAGSMALLLSLTPAPERAAALQAIPPVLDPWYRHPKRHQIELAPFIGSYLGATLRKSWMTGLHGRFHLSRLLSVGASYGYSRHAVNHLGVAGDLLRDHHAHYLTAEAGISTDVAMRMGQTLIEMDLFTTLGVGARRLDGEWRALGLIGGGVKFYTGLPWLAIRIDVNNYIHKIPLSTGGTTDVDVSFQLGASFLLPPRRGPLRRR